MKYLHLINDEKFTEFTISQFEECNEGNNFFLIGVSDANKKSVFTQEKPYTKFIKKGAAEYIEFVLKTDYDVLVIHNLDYFKSQVVNKVDKTKKVVWSAWGVDI